MSTRQSLMIASLSILLAFSIKYLVFSRNEAPKQNQQTSWKVTYNDEDLRNQIVINTRILSNNNNEFAFNLICDPETQTVFSSITSYDMKFDVIEADLLNELEHDRVFIMLELPDGFEIFSLPLNFYIPKENVQNLVFHDPDTTKEFLKWDYVIFKLSKNKGDYENPKVVKDVFKIKFDHKLNVKIQEAFYKKGCFIPLHQKD